jgi:penicillin-binding protein 1A
MAVNGMIAIEAAHGIGKDPIALSVDTHPSVGSAPEAMDYVRQELVKRYGAEKLDELGGMVTTSIDADYQSKARRILEHGLEAVSRRHSPHGVPQSAIEAGLQGCIVAIDPRTHEVRAMVGGYDFRAGGFNRALVSRRQAGSLFKAFVYAAGLKTGAFTPNTTFEDEEVFLDSKRPETPWPNNYEPEFQGTVTVTDAFARSINTVAVQALQETGITSVIGTARSLGITTAIPRDLSLALGTGTVVPLEIANAYASIAAGGTFAKPVFITEVNGSAEAAGAPVQVLSTETADEMVGLMRAVVEQGTGGAARGKLPFALAGKTGTTSDHSDAWFAGFSRELVTVVWVGYDKTRSIGDHETGARAALPIWLEFMGQALIGKSVVNLDAPVRILPPREEEEATDTGSEGGSLGIGSGVDDEFEAPDVTDDDGPELPTLDDTEVELPQTDEE